MEYVQKLTKAKDKPVGLINVTLGSFLFHVFLTQPTSQSFVGLLLHDCEWPGLLNAGPGSGPGPVLRPVMVFVSSDFSGFLVAQVLVYCLWCFEVLIHPCALCLTVVCVLSCFPCSVIVMSGSHVFALVPCLIFSSTSSVFLCLDFCLV